MRHDFLLCAFAVSALACSESTGAKPDAGGGGTGGVDVSQEGTPLAVPVPDSGRAFVDLAAPAVLTPPDDGMASTDWDLAFGGLEVFTNGGVSGPGTGSAFGPLSADTFLDDFAPTVPFPIEDETGGAFIDWWKYDNAEHVIWSRYHVYGVKDGDRYFKVQVLGFYGEVAGAPVTAIYSLRWAEVTEAGSDPTEELLDLDGTAGGSEAPPDEPSECLDLVSGKRTMYTTDQARAASDWHLCFRRAAVSVNGGVGGPRGVMAVDLQAAQTEGETLEQVKAKTAASEQPGFDAVDWAKLSDPALEYASDQIVTAFTGRWIVDGSSPPAPEAVAWYVIGADGTTKFLLVFEKFDGATDATPGTVHLRTKTVE